MGLVLSECPHRHLPHDGESRRCKSIAGGGDWWSYLGANEQNHRNEYEPLLGLSKMCGDPSVCVGVGRSGFRGPHSLIPVLSDIGRFDPSDLRPIPTSAPHLPCAAVVSPGQARDNPGLGRYRKVWDSRTRWDPDQEPAFPSGQEVQSGQFVVVTIGWTNDPRPAASCWFARRLARFVTV